MFSSPVRINFYFVIDFKDQKSPTGNFSHMKKYSRVIEDLKKLLQGSYGQILYLHCRMAQVTEYRHNLEIEVKEWEYENREVRDFTFTQRNKLSLCTMRAKLDYERCINTLEHTKEKAPR